MGESKIQNYTELVFVAIGGTTLYGAPIASRRDTHGQCLYRCQWRGARQNENGDKKKSN